MNAGRPQEGFLEWEPVYGGAVGRVMGTRLQTFWNVPCGRRPRGMLSPVFLKSGVTGHIFGCAQVGGVFIIT